MVEQTKTHKGFKKTDIGKIPEDWNLKQIKDFTEVVSGGTPSTNIEEYWGGDIKWMSSGELNLKRVHDVNGRITEIGLNKSATKIVPSNCVLVGLAGQGKTRGTVAINYISLCTNQSIASILPNKEVLSEYLYQNLDKRYKELRSLSTGDGGRGGLNLTLIRKLLIPLPPTKEEQTAIATALRDTDELISSLEKLIAKKRLIKQGAMQELLKPKEDWDVDTLGNIVEKITTGKLDANAMIANGEYRFYTCARDYYYINTYAFDDEALLISGNGENVGYVHYYKGKFNAYQRTYVLTGFLKNINFIKLYLDKYLPKRIETEVKSGNTPYITMTTLTDMKLFFPNEEQEQIRIATILSDMDTEIEVLEKKLAKYKLIKQGMMQNLLTGKIRLL